MAPAPYGGGVEALIPNNRLDELVELVHGHADATLPELAELSSNHFGVQMSTGAVCRALKRADITRKKTTVAKFS